MLTMLNSTQAVSSIGMELNFIYNLNLIDNLL